MSEYCRSTYLIAYDIACPKRLRKVHRHLSSQALAVQYSVFLAQISRPDLEGLLFSMGPLISDREDDVRIYPIPARCEAVCIGRQPIPRGVFLAAEELMRVLKPPTTPILSP